LKPDKKPLFSFGVFADAQYADVEDGYDRFYRSSENRLREAYEVFKSDSVDFVANLGDLIDRDFGSFMPVMDIINSSGVKTFHLTGNHDYSVDNRYKKKIPVLKENQKGYYSFSHKGFRFIFLNGNEISTYASANRNEAKKAEALLKQMSDSGKMNAVEWNGGMSSRQIEWLRDQLDQSVTTVEKVFILCHFPVFPDNKHNLLNYNDLLSLLDNYNNIIAWLSGHNHEGNYGNFNLIHFYTFRGMVETPNSNSFAVVEVYNNRIWIRGSGREKNMILAY
jgi:predicted phosphodiesterase